MPWLFVLGVGGANEIIDLLEQFPGRPASQWNAALRVAGPEALKDLWNTLLWPTVLLVVGRYTNLLEPSSRLKPNIDDVPPEEDADFA